MKEYYTTLTSTAYPYRRLQVDPQAEGAPEYTPYNYCFNIPLINVDPDGEFPWGVPAVGAFIGGASNSIIQVSVNMMRGDNLGEAVKHINFVEVSTSAAAGAIGAFVGVSASGLGKGSQILINTVTDASLNAGTQYVQKGSVDAEQVVYSVGASLLGQGAGSIIGSKVKSGNEFKVLEWQAERDARVAVKSTSRQTAKKNKAIASNKKSRDYIQKRETVANTTTSNAANKLAEKEDKEGNAK